MRLDALLQEQREALREGRLEALVSVAQRLERALATGAPDLTDTDAARLRKDAAENGRLLRAALSGLADARALRRGAQGATLLTYDASGRLSPAKTSDQTLVGRS